VRVGGLGVRLQSFDCDTATDSDTDPDTCNDAESASAEATGDELLMLDVA